MIETLTVYMALCG